ncbi:GTP-binding protein [Streptomyces sp. CSDS2]|uniref:sulfate adenylyltransferase subunit 1 n=1 Tax=Streptomyces sp. CSDS2 TaxID=3055051 RepID=UPI0025AEF0D8|nr:GTP-binding protein [Streptomyces sp. CSDS2]MDN3260525.1 GTP-binding protein [Streptomyces sp. CSDS2]
MTTSTDRCAESRASTLLRFATAGSVDDGKSTLVGRLLHDSKAVLADQLEAVETASRRRGRNTADLALLTDGLRAEREQGITIDVAYRYFGTPRRRFILADTPGHVQYTRNMVTGASNADLAVVLVDARNGILEQTRRHAAIAALLRVPHVVLAVNKMDLADYDEAVFASVADEFAAYAARLGLPDTAAIPMSALAGDNVVEPSRHMPWYAGPTLLEHLETVRIGADPTAAPARLPIQYVIRPGQGDFRGYAGRLASGALATGDTVTVLPSGRTGTVTAIDVLGTATDRVTAGRSLTLRLAEDIDISRGDMIVSGLAPRVGRDIEATVCHLHERPLRTGDKVLVKHGTRTVRAVVRKIAHRIDIDTLTRRPADHGLGVNDIGSVLLRTAEPLVVDDYADNRRTGSFLVIDPADGTTRAGGMIGRATEGWGCDV